MNLSYPAPAQIYSVKYKDQYRHLILLIILNCIMLNIFFNLAEYISHLIIIQ